MSEAPVPRTMDLAEAASFLKMHPDTLQRKARADLRMVMNYAHHSPGHLARYANNNLKKEM